MGDVCVCVWGGGEGEECMHYLQIQHEPVVESLDISIPLTLGEGEEGWWCVCKDGFNGLLTFQINGTNNK